MTGSNDRKALAVTRSLGRANIKVINADHRKLAVSFFSKYSCSHFLSPTYKYHEAFIKKIKYYIEKKNIKVLMPTDVETFVISEYKSSLSSKVKIPIADYEKIDKANNKRFLMEFANEKGFRVPQTYTINELSDLKHLSEEIKYPAVIKLIRGGGSKGLRYVYSKQELISEYKNVINQFNLSLIEYPLIQEYIPGDGFGVSMLFNNGDPRAIFTHKRIREYPITGGPSTARVSVRHSEMEKIATKLLKELEWHGLAMVEFKLDKRSNEPVLLEINPRIWGSINQAIVAGVNFPYLLYNMALDGDIKPVFNYKTGIKTRYLLDDFRALLSYIKTDKKNSEQFKDFFRFYEQNLFYDDISLEDPLPTFLNPIVNLFNHLNKRLKI